MVLMKMVMMKDDESQIWKLMKVMKVMMMTMMMMMMMMMRMDTIIVKLIMAIHLVQAEVCHCHFLTWQESLKVSTVPNVIWGDSV